jgi:RHS repeat-associated protein
VYTDPQGTTLAEADQNGNVIAQFDYRPYGSAYSGAGMASPENGPGYTGHVSDLDTGLIYMQARYYDASIGRFLSIDPVSPALGGPAFFNRFSYVGNNPVSRTDPFGQYFCQSKGGCAEFASALSQLKQAGAAFSPSSKEGKAIAAVIAYFGDANKKNANGQTVNVKQGPTSTGNPAEIGHNSFTGHDTVTFDFAQIKAGPGTSMVEMSASVAHEGQHGVDDFARRGAHIKETPDTVNATEHNAYRVQSYVNQGLGTSSPYGLWQSNWPSDEVGVRRDAAIDDYSAQSVKAWEAQHK